MVCYDIFKCLRQKKETISKGINFPCQQYRTKEFAKVKQTLNMALI